MCILSSREQTCIHDVVKTKPNKNDECIRLLDLNKCPFYRSGEKLSDHEAIQPGGSLEVFDIEDLVALGNRERACPYFAMRSAMSKADIVFCPYNYLVDPVLREAIDIDITDAIIVIDEAHNIEDVCRAAVSKEIRYEDLECESTCSINCLLLLFLSDFTNYFFFLRGPHSCQQRIESTH